MTPVHPFRLDGKTVRLRDLRSGDLDDVAPILGDDRVTYWLSFDSRDRESSRHILTSAIMSAAEWPRTEYYLGITLPADDRVIGFARLALGGVHAAKIGYAVHADHWGQGYATDAVSTLVGYGFHELHLHRVTAAVGPSNGASIRVLERLGFVREGTLRHHVFTNGAWRDSLLYSVLEQDP